jgi:hypothetical protein
VCEGVDYTSATFDPFLDLSLEINKAGSVGRALAHFTAEEVLDGDNRYRCPKNNKLVSRVWCAVEGLWPGGASRRVVWCVLSSIQGKPHALLSDPLCPPPMPNNLRCARTSASASRTRPTC